MSARSSILAHESHTRKGIAMSETAERPKKKRGPPSTDTLTVRAFSKVQRLKSEIARRRAAESKHQDRYAKTMKEKKAALKDAEAAFALLNGTLPAVASDA